MLHKYSLIAILLAVCVDRSFEQLKILDCISEEHCLKIVHKENLKIGIVPIIVTDDNQNKIENDIVEYLKRKNPNFQILRIHKVRNRSQLTAKYLEAGIPHGWTILYPIVAMMVDHRVIHTKVLGGDLTEIDNLLKMAENPKEEYFTRGYHNFSYDVIQMIDNQPGQKHIGKKYIQVDQEVRLAAMSAPLKNEVKLEPSDFGYEMYGAWGDLYDIVRESAIKFGPKMPPDEPKSNKRKREPENFNKGKRIMKSEN